MNEQSDIDRFPLRAAENDAALEQHLLDEGAWPNQREITVRAKHYLTEDCPHEIGEAVAEFVKHLRG